MIIALSLRSRHRMSNGQGPIAELWNLQCNRSYTSRFDEISSEWRSMSVVVISVLDLSLLRKLDCYITLPALCIF